ncbi:hypothetical protein BDM02DRAFT_3193876 [Thelephora ganbajun]|uniref:Uncharacterized protein n=1 Tax=Thelephora ganbajun TaxID=370292 RepID=A0ACB6YXU5_THEGA|nr:hypothetical protein BDM02DRAFT_3193876 [Thelephora ganbajun]
MAPKRSEKKPPSTSTMATTADASTKPPWTAWKTGEQLEWLLSYWEDFITHQTEGTLDCFWPRVYHTWYLKWLITLTPQSINQWGSHENAVLTLHSESNTRICMWFHNHTCPGSKAAKSDLQLNQNEKQKLAPAQAYCTYTWDKGLRDVVIARWEGQKQSYMSVDEGDPTADSIETPGSGSHIPIDFKLKVAKDIYNSLSVEEKKLVDDHREDERRKLYRSIPEITDIKERDRKLLMHQQNQPLVPKSLLRIFKNLEDQAGCWGSHENAVLTLHSESNTRICMWFHNHTCPGSKAAKSDLQLNQNEKQKLAPAQAYCTYTWDKGLRDVVIARWEGQKQSYMSVDEGDPTADSIETPGSGSHIPIDFKLKVAKDIYNSLSVEEKKLVDDHREDERRKLYRSIPEITDIKERDRKLLMHQQNQPLVPKSLLRIFKNLEDQAGCVMAR